MDTLVAYGSGEYFVLLAALLFARGMDLLSTWVASPRLLLEGNPIARRLGWRGGLCFNLLFCGLIAAAPLGSIIVCTTSVLVAARNFQNAWVMRATGEEGYREWRSERLSETPLALFLASVGGETLLFALVGTALILHSIFLLAPHGLELVPLGIGLGTLFYALAVLFFTLLALWRARRAEP